MSWRICGVCQTPNPSPPPVTITPNIPLLQNLLRIKNCRQEFLKEASKVFLPRRDYPFFRAQCQRVSSDPKSVPQSTAGKTRVYLLKDIVLKAVFRSHAIHRMEQMRDVKRVVEIEDIRDLIVPKFVLGCRRYLVEERLPINIDPQYNMYLYLLNLPLFDGAARELTRLFSVIYIGDLIYYKPGFSPFPFILGKQVRYDNIPFYISEGQGKIGLIDLERLENKPSLNGLAVVARIFPYHLDIIIEEAQRLNMTIDEEELHLASEQGKDYLKRGCTDRIQWLKNKGITIHSPHTKFTLTQLRIKELSAILSHHLLSLNRGENIPCWFETTKIHFLLAPFKQSAERIGRCVAKKLIDNLTKTIELCSLQNRKISSITDVVNSRSRSFNKSRFYADIPAFIREHDGINTDAFHLNEGDFKKHIKKLYNTSTFVVGSDPSQKSATRPGPFSSSPSPADRSSLIIRFVDYGTHKLSFFKGSEKEEMAYTESIAERLFDVLMLHLVSRSEILYYEPFAKIWIRWFFLLNTAKKK